MSRGIKVLTFMLVAGVTAAVSGCAEDCPEGSYCVDDEEVTLPAATAAPAFAGVPWQAPWGDVETYINSLHFDSSHTAGHGSFLPLGAPGPLTLGPYVTFFPERGAGQADTAAVNRGRIIARIYASANYPPLGIRAGVSYVWVDTVGGGRMVFVPANLNPPVTTRAVVLAASYKLPCTIMASANIKIQAAGNTMICMCCPFGGYCEDGPVIDSLTN